MEKIKNGFSSEQKHLKNLGLENQKTFASLM